jgi:hypothetical protein
MDFLLFLKSTEWKESVFPPGNLTKQAVLSEPINLQRDYKYPILDHRVTVIK